MATISDNYIVARVGEGIDAHRVYKSLPSHELNLLYDAADILISTSLEKGFGPRPVEAMHTGLTVILSDREFFHEIAGDATIYVDPLSVDSILSGIKEAINSADELKVRVLESSKKYSFENFTLKMNDYYRSVIGNQNIKSK